MRALDLSPNRVLRGDLILVDRDHPLRAAPSPFLVPLGSQGVLLERRAAGLLDACLRELGASGKIVPVSGWRTREDQQHIWDGSLAEHGPDFTGRYVALPGCSEHQTGLAIDLGRVRPKIDFLRPAFPCHGVCGRFRRLAPRYGFIERYPAGKEAVTGIAHEPWHFRYVGVPHAEIMTARGWTLEEYLRHLKDRLGAPPLLWQSGRRTYRISYIPAAPDGPTCLDIDSDGPCLLSGDNEAGFVLTQWEEGGRLCV